MRNIDGMLTQCRMRTPVAMHAFGSNAANGEDVQGEETRLPPPQQHLLTVLSEPEFAELIERYIDFVDRTSRSVHLASPFVRHYMQRTDSALPIAGAMATLPLILADGAVLAEPGPEPRARHRVPARARDSGAHAAPGELQRRRGSGGHAFPLRRVAGRRGDFLRREVHSDRSCDDDHRALLIPGPTGLLGHRRPPRRR